VIEENAIRHLRLLDVTMTHNNDTTFNNLAVMPAVVCVAGLAIGAL